MSVINIHAAKTQFSRLIEEVAAGGDVVIAKAGKPVARLVPIAPSPGRRKLGILADKITVPLDFDAALPSEILDAFDGR